MKISAKIGCIEIQGCEVRLVILKTGRKAPKILESYFARAEFTEEEDRFEALVQTAKEVLGRVKSPPAAYVLAGSNAWTVVRLLKIPFKGRRVGAAVQFELEPYLAFSIDELEIAHLPIREVEGETEVLVVGMRREHIAENVTILGEAGVDVEGVGIDSLGIVSLWRSVEKKPAPGLHAFVHLCTDTGFVAVVEDKKLAYIRHLPLTASQLQENPRAAAREVHNVLRAFSASRSDETEIGSLALSGITLFEEELSLFEDIFAMPVHCCDVLGTLQGTLCRDDEENSEKDAHTHRWAGCVGVGMSATGDSFFMNFLNGDLRPRTAQRGLIAHAVFSSVLAFAALLLYFGYSYVDYRKNTAEIDRIGQSIWEEVKSTFPDSQIAAARPAGDIGGFKSAEFMEREADTENRGSSRLSIDMFTKGTLLDILMELAEKVPDAKVGIGDLSITTGKTSQVIIAGEIKDPTAFAQIFADLEQSEIIKVTPQGRRRESSAGRETYVITANR